jgi:hypothetical protein
MHGATILMRYFVRLFGRGVFVALAGLAVAIAIVSFLTACRCGEPFIVQDRSQPIVTKPSREDSEKTLNTNQKAPPPPQLTSIPAAPPNTKDN